MENWGYGWGKLGGEMHEKSQKNITEPVTELGISKLGGFAPSPPLVSGHFAHMSIRPHHRVILP